MRKNIQSQLSLVNQPIQHEHADELNAMSARLDALPGAIELVSEDIKRCLTKPNVGREGLCPEIILRAMLLKQMRSFSYQLLTFHLADSLTYRRFCRIGFADPVPSASALQRDIVKIRPETLEKINRLLLGEAAQEGIEKGRKVRVDCTVTETNIHEPTDAELLWDCVRVLLRKLNRSRTLADIEFVNHIRSAKRRRMEIRTGNKKVRVKAYGKLLEMTRKTVDYARSAASCLKKVCKYDSMKKAHGLAARLLHFAALADRIIDQTYRRVFLEEKVPAQEKLVSIFETHTDIIIKGRRKVDYGHKLCLASGSSGLFTDLVIEEGNPPDSLLAVKMAERHKEIFGCASRKIAFDGGFASKKNLAEIKAVGFQDVAFSKRRGLEIHDMVKSSWVYRQLKNFRAGIEAGISFLKRCFGLTRCHWRGFNSFKTYAWASVLTANLLTMARHDLR